MACTRSMHVPHISIHALREEGDRMLLQQRLDCLQFLSTPSARRATAVLRIKGHCQ